MPWRKNEGDVAHLPWRKNEGDVAHCHGGLGKLLGALLIATADWPSRSKRTKTTLSLVSLIKQDGGFDRLLRRCGTTLRPGTTAS